MTAKKKSMFPTAAQQAAVGAFQSVIAYHVAEAQTRRGVDPATATTHAVRASLAVVAYGILVLPVTIGIGILVWPNDPLLLLWSRLVALLGVWLGVRLHRYVYTPAYVRLTYRFPTFLMACLGGIMVPIGMLALTLSYLTTPYQY